MSMRVRRARRSAGRALFVSCTAAVMLLAGGACRSDSPPATAAARAATTTSTSAVVTTTTEHHEVGLAAGQPDVDHPSPALTPGAIFADATVERICVTGYTASVRAVSDSLRDQVYAEYHVAAADRSRYDVDHLIALELGGSNDLANLWPEPKSGSDAATSKDSVENRLHALVCDRQVSLADAQVAIVHWDTADASALATTTAPRAPAAPPTTVLAVPPVTAPPDTTPPPVVPQDTVAADGPTALCNDGTYSYAAHHQGACSHHGGVNVFYK